LSYDRYMTGIYQAYKHFWGFQMGVGGGGGVVVGIGRRGGKTRHLKIKIRAIRGHWNKAFCFNFIVESEREGN
jgi:hypothetical protein